MSTSIETDAQLSRSWEVNAEAWTRVVRDGRIESRRLGTDAAILEAILARMPRRVLDVGCGEGWLCRALAVHGIETVGVDGSAPLIEAARQAGGGPYHVLDYTSLIADPAALVRRRFDVAVFNFALLDEDPSSLLRAVASRLRLNGALLIQTVHPWTARGDAPYADGWREERFASFGDTFAASTPWYYRTLGSWLRVLGQAGLTLEVVREPLHPETGIPLSLLLEATPRSQSRTR
ncbi:MAG TPA: class I SAM-dependent methyltransferase [Rhodothermales bacterium]|nr:class I SAM-dependent methyltransferase [Rhodothermales bacterium]